MLLVRDCFFRMLMCCTYNLWVFEEFAQEESAKGPLSLWQTQKEWKTRVKLGKRFLFQPKRQNNAAFPITPTCGHWSCSLTRPPAPGSHPSRWDQFRCDWHRPQLFSLIAFSQASLLHRLPRHYSDCTQPSITQWAHPKWINQSGWQCPPWFLSLTPSPLNLRLISRRTLLKRPQSTSLSLFSTPLPSLFSLHQHSIRVPLPANGDPVGLSCLRSAGDTDLMLGLLQVSLSDLTQRQKSPIVLQ